MIKHIITRYPNYNLKSFKEYNNDILTWEENYDEDGKKHGRNNSYNKMNDGITIKIQTDYNHGVEHGMYKSWYPNGNKCMEVFYINGNEHGTFKFYSLKALYQTIQYVNGIFHGKVITYNSDGSLYKEVIYENNIKINTINYSEKLNLD